VKESAPTVHSALPLPNPPSWPWPPLVKASAAVHAGAAALALAPGGWPWALGALVANHAVLTASRPVAAQQRAGPQRDAAAGRTTGVAITIDDGPDPEVTPAVLDQLDAAGARATFFCIGEFAQQHRRWCATSCAAATRCRTTATSTASFLAEGARARPNARSAGAAGAGRPERPRAALLSRPGRLRNPLLDPVLHRLGLHLVSWTRRGFDTREADPQRVLQRLTKAGRRRHPAAARRPRAPHRRRPPRGAGRAAGAAAALRRRRPEDRDAGRGPAGPLCPMSSVLAAQGTTRPRHRSRPGARCTNRPARRTGARAALPGTSRAASWGATRSSAACWNGVTSAAPSTAQGPTRVVDIGCGQGLMASLLQACGDAAAQGRWPQAWGPAPRAGAYTGIELMPKDVQRAQAAVGGLPLAPRFVCADMCAAALPDCDLVVILDVLHYVDHDAQAAVLAKVRRALGAQGRLLLRMGDMSHPGGFAVSQWVDRVVTLVRGHRVPPTFGRTVRNGPSCCAGWALRVCRRCP
jgi:peptidoglycan/xylan/chitin deacetylase (PgdA/CDA1 family)/ubiquinone/menaquinone biosynthesis C-methylase UbiE